MMNSYWQVLRTYLWRPRFWLLAVTYLLIVWVWFWAIEWDSELQRRGQAVASAVFASLAGCFLALHVRRQFSTASAQIVPGYAVPHLVVAGFVSALLWLIIPLIAIGAGRWQTGTLAFHAMAAILMVVVACWPRGILLLVTVPVLLVWSNRLLPKGQTPLLISLANGDRPWLAATLIALAVVGQMVAVWFLLRVSRQGITTNDEFTLDSPSSNQDLNPLSRWMLTARDAAAQRLMEARTFRSIQRWRVPVATSPLQYLSPFMVVLIACGIGWSLGNTGEWGVFAIAVTSAVLLLAPLAPWHFRRRTMSQELLLPVSRERYFREMTIAMAFDVILWTAISSILIAAPFLIALAKEPQVYGDLRFWLPLLAFLSVAWSMAIFIFGVGLATIRWSLWIPIVAAISMVWFFGLWITLVVVLEKMEWRIGESWGFAFFIALTFAQGLLLVCFTYRRWVRSDVT
jgi:hypothetical protein